MTNKTTKQEDEEFIKETEQLIKEAKKVFFYDDK